MCNLKNSSHHRDTPLHEFNEVMHDFVKASYKINEFMHGFDKGLHEIQ